MLKGRRNARDVVGELGQGRALMGLIANPNIQRLKAALEEPQDPGGGWG